MAEQTQTPTIAPNNRVYYTHGDLLIDLKHYIHNLNTNLNRFLDSRRHWSEGQKLVFRERFEAFKNGLLAQLESGGNRFNTGTDGLINDLEGEISNGKDLVYVDSLGNVYNTAEGESELTAFDVSHELGKYASRIGGAISARGLNKSYYDKIYEAKVKATEKLAAREAAQQLAALESAATGGSTEFNADTQGFLAHLKLNSNIYNSADNLFKWDVIYGLDSDPNSFDQRASGLGSLIELYYNTATNAQVDFSKSQYGSKENYLKALQDAYNSLKDGYLESDNTALNAIGLDNSFLGNWFSTINPQERTVTEQLLLKQTEIIQKIANIPVNLSEKAPLEGSEWNITKDVSYADKGTDKDVLLAFDLFTSGVNMGATPFHKDKEKVGAYIENVKKTIVNNLKSGSNYEQTVNLVSNLVAYDKVLRNHLLEGNFIQDGELEYLDYRDPNSGVVVVYNPSKKSVYLKKLSDSQDTEIFNRVVSKLVSYNKEGGKFAEGGEIAEINDTIATNLEGQNPKAIRHAEAKLGWNAQGSTMSDENFKMEYEDYARIATLATNIGSIFADPGSGAVLGVAASVGDLTADIADESLSGWDAAKNFATNLGLDVVALIPGMESLKIARSIKGMAGMLTKGLAAYGVLNTVSNGDAILSGIKNVAAGNYSRQDFLNAAQGVLLLASAIKTGKTAYKNNKNVKAIAGTADDKIGVRITQNDGLSKDIEVKGEVANKIREAAKNKNQAEVDRLVNEYLGGTAEAPVAKVAQRLDTTTPLKGQLSWKFITKDTKIDVFETAGKSDSRIGKLLARETEPIASKELPTIDPNAPRKLETVDQFEQTYGLQNLKNLEETSKVRKTTIDLVKEQKQLLKQAEKQLLDLETQMNERILQRVNAPKQYVTADNKTHTTEQEFLQNILERSTNVKKAIAETRRLIAEKADAGHLTDKEYNRLMGELETKLKNEELLMKDLQLGNEYFLKNTKEAITRDELAAAAPELERLTQEKTNSEDQLKNLVKVLSENTTNWKKIKKLLLSEEGYEIGGVRYRTSEKILNDITKKYGILHKEGGVIKMQNGGVADPYLAVIWDYNTRYRNKFTDASTFGLVDRGNDYNTDAVAADNGGYDIESHIPYTGTGNYVSQGKLVEEKNKNFYNALVNNKELAYNWAKRYLELNKAKNGKWTEGWFNNNDASSIDNFNFDTFKNSSLWRDLKNGIGHDVYKGKTYYIKDSNGNETYYSSIPEGYTASNAGENHDDIITKYLLTKNGEAPAKTPSLGEYEEYFDDEVPEYGYEYGDEDYGEEGPGQFGGQDPIKALAAKRNIILGLIDKVPEISEYLRMRWLNKKADKLTNMALEGTQPFLLDPYEVHRMVYGDYRAKMEGQKAAALLNSIASRPLTSDGALLTATLLEAKVKGQQYIDAGNKADDVMIRATAEKVWQLEKENVYNRWKIAMENRRSIHTTLADRAKIRHAGESVKINNANTYWMDVIKNMRDKVQTRKNETLLADLRDIAKLATINPQILGIDLSQVELEALNEVVHGGLSYNNLSDAHKRAYVVARQKLLWAESNYARKYRGLPVSPFEEAIKDGLNESWATITDAPENESDATYFKDGGLVKITVAKIREKMKNADRHLKNVHKQIDSLDKKLDRISKSMYGVAKVALLK